MKKDNIESFDISSYDIEIEYNEKIAPITSKIQKLNKSHESKSLKAHKDFLAKEKKSESNINVLKDKEIVRTQRLEKATKNKLVKLDNKKTRLLENFEAYKVDERIAFDEKIITIKDQINELKAKEQLDINEIKTKYQKNIESYKEKLDIYNNNFEKNKKHYQESIEQYKQDIMQTRDRLLQKHQEIIAEINQKLSEYQNIIEAQNNTIETSTKAITREQNQLTTNVRKNANVVITENKAYVNQFQNHLEEHYQDIVDSLQKEKQALKDAFDEKLDLIDKDLQINIEKLESQLIEIKETKNKKAIKNIEMKIELFNLRASTVKEIEQKILQEKVDFIDAQIPLFKYENKYETINFDKLLLFLEANQRQIKETADYFAEVNINLRSKLAEFESNNTAFQLKHQSMKRNYLDTQLNIFDDYKLAIIDLADTYLERIAENNIEMDEIHRFLDTAEPLKEIEVNRIKEEIEVHEVNERYKIKYKKEEMDISLLEKEYQYLVDQKQVELDNDIAALKKEYDLIKNNEMNTKALNNAKLLLKIAEENNKVRMNNRKLERKLLEDKYESELQIKELNKQIAEIEVRKHSDLLLKEIDHAIDRIQTNAKYQTQLVQKNLEESIIKQKELVTKTHNEINAYKVNLDAEIKNKKQSIENEKEQIKKNIEERLLKIDEALEREKRIPLVNVKQTQNMIDSKLRVLDNNTASFAEYINHTIDGFSKDDLSIKQLREIAMNTDNLKKEASLFIERAYQSLTTSMEFMQEIETRVLMNEISSLSENAKIKKLNKQKNKLLSEHQKQISQITTAQKDHINLINVFIDSKIKEIKKVNAKDISALMEEIITRYNQIFDKLKSLQKNVVKEIKTLYAPLSSKDQELITNAERNAEIAKQKVIDHGKEELLPFETKLTTFIANKEKESQEHLAVLNKQHSEYKAEINHKKNEALEQINTINQNRDETLAPKLELKKDIELNIEKKVVNRIENIDKIIEDLRLKYQKQQQKLNEKDQEAEKILNYEENIYNIQVDSANAKQQDMDLKVNHAYQAKLSNNKKQLANKAKEYEEYITRNKAELKQLTNELERNIFMAKPKDEETIGDAQKSIEEQISDKRQRLSELEKQNNDIIQSAENNLFATFTKGFERLNKALDVYLDKVKVVENEMFTTVQNVNQAISENNQAFEKSIYEISKKKHSDVLQQILQINQTMLGREE